MGNEVTQPEAAMFHFWLRGFMVGGKMDKEVTLPEATKRKRLFLISRASSFGGGALFSAVTWAMRQHNPKATKRNKHL